MEPVCGQDDRKRERHAREGVWLPAGEGQHNPRGFPDSRHTSKARGQGGMALCPLAAPANGRLAILPSRRGRNGPNKINQQNRV